MATLSWKNKRAYAVKTWTDNGRQHRQWIPLGKFERKIDGKKAFEDWIRWGASEKGKTVIFEELLPRFFKLSESQVAPDTLKFEKAHSKSLEKEFGPLPLHEITALKLEEFKSKNKWEATTWRNKLGLLKKIIKYAEAHGFKTSEPFKTVKIPSPKIHEFPTRAVSIEILDSLINQMLPHYKQFAAIMRYTGMRPAEVLRLQPGDINIEKQIINILGKSGRYEALPFSEKMIPFLTDELPIKIDLRSFNRHLRRLCNKLKFPFISSYVFRHSVATYVSDQNPPGGLRTVQALLRHSTPYLTARYARATDHGLRTAAEMLGKNSKESEAKK